MTSTGQNSVTEISIGFMPLVDCAPVIVAAEKGFALANDLRLTLLRETSWANIRDRVALGHFDAAHMLGPLAIAMSLGLGRHVKTPMIAPFSLGRGGTAITVSLDLWSRLEGEGVSPGDPPGGTAAAMARVIASRRQRPGAEPLTFAMVHPFSSHNYDLRYWLASAGVDPDHDIRLVVLPPPFMADALREGHVDAICVGEPWNSLAVEAGHGVIVATKSELWRQGPEKVIGLRASFADRAPEQLARLLRALHDASVWAGNPANFDELADIMSTEGYLATPAPIIRRALSGEIVLRRGLDPVRMPGFLEFSAEAANVPWPSHALWSYSQMVRWGQTAYSPADAETARRVYRPDLYRLAMGFAGDVGPTLSTVGGAPLPGDLLAPFGDGLFDAIPFNPADIEGYLRELSESSAQ